MIRPRHMPAVAAFALGLQSAGMACTDPPEALKIGSSDVVIDGVAACDLQRGRCRVRATEVVKDDARRRTDSDFYALRFEPGAVEQLFRAMEQAGELWMCVLPWEPESPRFEGRFYLNRAGSSFRPHQYSARGHAPIEEAAE